MFVKTATLAHSPLIHVFTGATFAQWLSSGNRDHTAREASSLYSLILNRASLPIWGLHSSTEKMQERELTHYPQAVTWYKPSMQVAEMTPLSVPVTMVLSDNLTHCREGRLHMRNHLGWHMRASMAECLNYVNGCGQI